MHSHWLHWLTPILATLTVIFEAGHLTAHVPPEFVVMILALLTAIMAWVEGLTAVPAVVPTVYPAPPPQPGAKGGK